jgi:hypothetical protein
MEFELYMKSTKIVLASLFAVLMILGLSQSARASTGNPDLVIGPSEVNVTVGNTFQIQISINSIPAPYAMIDFDFYIFWDKTMMDLEVLGNPVASRGWTVDLQVSHDDWYEFGANKGSGTPWSTDAVWLTMGFRCIGEGSSEITVSGEDSVWLSDGITTPFNTAFDEDAITCNQRRSAPSNPYHYVGGELYTANKLAVLSPYLALFSVVAVAAGLVKRRKN